MVRENIPAVNETDLEMGLGGTEKDERSKCDQEQKNVKACAILFVFISFACMLVGLIVFCTGAEAGVEFGVKPSDSVPGLDKRSEELFRVARHINENYMLCIQSMCSLCIFKLLPEAGSSFSPQKWERIHNQAVKQLKWLDQRAAGLIQELMKEEGGQERTTSIPHKEENRNLAQRYDYLLSLFQLLQNEAVEGQPTFEELVQNLTADMLEQLEAEKRSDENGKPTAGDLLRIQTEKLLRLLIQIVNPEKDEVNSQAVKLPKARA